jgi:ABC-type polysaccharide/polyol phosphate export permease
MCSAQSAMSDEVVSEFGDHIAPSPLILALGDLAEGARLWRLWTLLAWYGVKQRYRRSVLGPFWLTISMGILILALGFLYSGIFAEATHRFLPHVAAGFIFWGLISSLVNDGCSVFLHAEQTIRNVELPYSVHVYRMITSSLILFGHNFLIFVIVMLTYRIQPSWSSLLAVFGLLLIIANGLWAGLLLGIIGLRYRDAPQMVGSIMHLSFFLTQSSGRSMRCPKTRPCWCG